MTVPTGFDTGFFVLLAREHAEGQRIWQEVVEGTRPGHVSAITFYELYKLALKTAIAKPVARLLIEACGRLCQVHWPRSLESLEAAARLSHGNGLSMADALILRPFLDAGCSVIYTSDRDLLAYDGTAQVELMSTED